MNKELEKIEKLQKELSKIEKLHKEYVKTICKLSIYGEYVDTDTERLRAIHKLIDKSEKCNKKMIKLIDKSLKKKAKKANKKAEIVPEAIVEEVISEDTREIKESSVVTDSTAKRDSLIEGYKKAKVKKDAEVVSEIILENIETPFVIDKQPGRLPVDCTCLEAKCVFTPQHTLIIKAGSVISGVMVEDRKRLSIATIKNLNRAFKRGDITKQEDGKYIINGDITCSSRLDGLRLISGLEDTREVHFYVGNMLLNDYLNLENIE